MKNKVRFVTLNVHLVSVFWQQDSSVSNSGAVKKSKLLFWFFIQFKEEH